ncbi:MAG: hypothetical protein ABR927_15525 [Bacteroidales bacterium]|jgi:hypothetical protein
MEHDNSSVSGSYTDIRFNAFYFVCVFIIAIIMMIGFLQTLKGKDWLSILFLILALIAFIHGIYALTRNKYIRLDKHSKKVIIYGFCGIAVRKYKYDRLFFKDKELYREYEGKTKFINILRSQCRKDDFEAFVVDVNKGD